MARTMRRRSTWNTGRRRSRRPSDWVYRSNGYAVNGFVADNLGTYEPTVFPVASGVGESRARILYDSSNYLTETARGGAGPVQLGREARAEGRRTKVVEVDGILYVEPSTWAVGNLIALGWRIGVFDQDVSSGFISLDANYSMWESGGAYAAAQWANATRQNLAERRIHFGFSDNQQFFTARIRWRGRRLLAENECLALYLELESTSVNTRMQCWCRTRVEK